MRRTPVWLFLVTFLLLVAVTTGCSAGSPSGSTAQPAPDATTSQGSPAYPTGAYPYPAPAAPTVDPAYPAPQPIATEVGRQPEPVPTPAEGMGVVHGMLYDQASDTPLYDTVQVYLSPVIGTSSSDMDAVSSDFTNDPHIGPDIQGGFAFGSVPPGRYGIVVQTPLKQYLARYASDMSKNVIVTVEAGKAVDLGKIYAGSS